MQYAYQLHCLYVLVRITVAITTDVDCVIYFFFEVINNDSCILKASSLSILYEEM